MIDSSLKCFLHMTFPVGINDEIKSSLQPLLNPVAVSKRFIFVPSIEHHLQLSAIEETDSVQNQFLAPPILITLITSQPETSAARQVTEVLKNSELVAVCFAVRPKSFQEPGAFSASEARIFFAALFTDCRECRMGNGEWNTSDATLPGKFRPYG